MRFQIGTVLMAIAPTCGIYDPPICTDNYVFGVVAEVTDLETGAPVSEGLTGHLEDGDYSEAMVLHGNRLSGAGERRGTYTLTVTAPGYAPAVTEGIEVEGDQCHVTRVDVSVKLAPVS